MRKALILTVAMIFAMAGFAAADASLDGLSVKAELFIEGVTQDLGAATYTNAAGEKVAYDKAGEYLNGRGRFWFNYTKNDWKGALTLEIGEFTSYAGKTGGYLGTTTARDGKAIEVKHLYVAGPLGPLTLSAGLQPIALGYGTILDEDYVALAAGAKVGAGNLLLAYIKHAETLYADEDVTCFAITYGGTFGGITLKPYAIYGLNESAADDFYFIGVPFGGKFGMVDVKAAFDYVGGEFGGTKDLSDFSLWAKAMVGLGAANVYVEGGYSTEFMKNIDENITYDIVFEDRARGTMGLKNITFGKIGANMTMGALLLDAAIIYDTYTEGKSIGTEVDLKATYKVADNVVVEAGYGYLLAGDALPDDQYKGYWKATYKY
jgi:hypothetical protein